MGHKSYMPQPEEAVVKLPKEERTTDVKGGKKPPSVKSTISQTV